MPSQGVKSPKRIQVNATCQLPPEPWAHLIPRYLHCSWRLEAIILLVPYQQECKAFVALIGKGTYALFIGLRWKAATAVSKLWATRETVVALTGSPNTGSRAWETFRVEIPNTKQAKINRSTWGALRA
jgi:hypothetical protein